MVTMFFLVQITMVSNHDKHRVINKCISLFGTMITMVTMVDGNLDGATDQMADLCITLYSL